MSLFPVIKKTLSAQVPLPAPSIHSLTRVPFAVATTLFGNVIIKFLCAVDCGFPAAFWRSLKRVPPPSMLTFDAATRDKCIVQRQNTNTPLQALVMLNDPQYMEAMRAMAQKIIDQSELVEDNITLAFRKLTSRKPTAEELQMLMEIFHESLTSFEENPTSASALINIGDYWIDESLNQSVLAAHSITFSAILNLDETITKE